MSKSCNIIIDDEVTCRIGGLHPSDQGVLYDKLGIYVDGYRYMPAYQLRRWDGKKHFFSDTGKTFTKLLDEILPYLIAWNYDVNIEDRRLPTKAVTTVVDADYFKLANSPDESLRFSFRDYQLRVINKLIEAGYGFGICATGSGKTSMCAALCHVFASHGLQTILIVPSGDLIRQTAEEFNKRYEAIGSDTITVGTYSGDSKNIDHPIVVATWQSLQNAPHYMGYFQVVIVDEAHGAKAEVIQSLINDHGKHIAYRYGVTGTFPKSEVDQYSLKSSIGPIVDTVDAAWLIAQGYLSSIEITAIETQDVSEEFPDYQSEKAFLAKSEERLANISKLIMQKRDELGNTLVLVNSINQGQALEELIPGSVFLWGESEKELREQNYKEYAEKDGIILIASVGIASTGISIDRIFVEWLIDIGKSFTKCIQSVGRGLRKKGDKSHIHVFDVYSKLKFSKKHFKKRKEYYNEAGYPVTKPVKLKYSVAIKQGLIS